MYSNYSISFNTSLKIAVSLPTTPASKQASCAAANGIETKLANCPGRHPLLGSRLFFLANALLPSLSSGERLPSAVH
jgi:hypothetical protein